ncbi:LppU/SCO3897 family protein [Streptomyces sirii]|uniref:LppU/SCO3897 family protein n=1 Tax=Streptomyces sirii TaxID=3127701 RepID=UPI003D366710
MFTPTGPERRPWLRPLIAVGVLAAIGVGFWGLSTLTDDSKPSAKDARDAKVGDCLENRGTHADPVLFTIPCSKAKATYKVVIDASLQGTCPRELDKYTERGGRQGETTLCLKPVHH